MHALIRLAVLTFAAAAVGGAPSAKALDLQPHGVNPQKCPSFATGTWPNCSCLPDTVLYNGACVHVPALANKFCVWRENNGTPFGVSGNCPAAANTEVGAPCACERTVEHKVVVHHGTVVAAPAAGPASVIH